MKLLFGIGFILSFIEVWSQNDSTSVYQDSVNNEIIVSSLQFHNSNPASAGVLNRTRVQAIQQLYIKENKPESYIGVDGVITKSKHFNLGSGLYYKHHNYNNLYLREYIGVILSGKFIYDNHRTSIGLSSAYTTTSFNWAKASFGDMIDPRLGFVYASSDIPRVGTSANIIVNFGVIHQWKDLKIGLSANNLTMANISVLGDNSLSPRTYNTNISYTFHINKFSITPLLNITNNGFNSFQNYSLIGQFKNKYFIMADVKTFEWKYPKTYSFKAGAVAYNSFYFSLGYSITPRLLDYAHQLTIHLSYVVPSKK